MENFETFAAALQAAGTAGLSFQQRLLSSGFNVNALRTNATLRRDEWILFDNTVLQIARARMVIVAELFRRGLTTRIPNALGITRIEWQNVGDLEGAEITMSGISESQNDRLDFGEGGMPLPIIHKDFNINLRALEASRRGGQPLDTLQAQVATRKVAETVERMVFTGATVLGSNNVIYGLTNAPQRNTGSVTAGFATATGAQIVGDVLEMIGVAQGDFQFGPYVLFVPTAVHTAFGADFKAESDRTVLDRVLAIPGIEAVIPTNDLTGNNVLLVQLTADNIDLLDGISPTLIEWTSHAGFVVHFKIICIQIPRVRANQLGQSGIVHYS